MFLEAALVLRCFNSKSAVDPFLEQMVSDTGSRFIPRVKGEGTDFLHSLVRSSDFCLRYGNMWFVVGIAVPDQTSVTTETAGELKTLEKNEGSPLWKIKE